MYMCVCGKRVEGEGEKEGRRGRVSNLCNFNGG